MILQWAFFLAKLTTNEDQTVYQLFMINDKSKTCTDQSKMYKSKNKADYI